jgi:hypothetical protein
MNMVTVRICRTSAMQPASTWCHHPAETGSTSAVNYGERMKSCITGYFFLCVDIVVEDIHKKREPLSMMEAVYLITPCDSSVQALMADFSNSNRCMYRAAHVYFTEGRVHTVNVIFLGWVEGWLDGLPLKRNCC